jgi:hypothetical protein
MRGDVYAVSVIRIVMKLCRPYWLLLTAFLLCLIVESVYGALSPLSFKFLIDDAFEPTSEAVARLQTQARLEPSGAIDPSFPVLPRLQIFIHIMWMEFLTDANSTI